MTPRLPLLLLLLLLPLQGTVHALSSSCCSCCCCSTSADPHVLPFVRVHSRPSNGAPAGMPALAGQPSSAEHALILNGVNIECFTYAS